MVIDICVDIGLLRASAYLACLQMGPAFTLSGKAGAIRLSRL